MNNEPRQPGNLLQRIWWAFRRLYHQLKPTRFSFIVALLACPVFLRVAQGTEILRTVGEGMAGDQSYAPRVCAFFAALLLWAVCSWYAARVLLYVNFPGLPRAPSQSEFADTHAPRLLGVAPILIVAGGFLVAAQPYGASPAKLWLYSFAGVCLLLAILFYVALIFRRRMIGETRRVEHIKELGGATVAAVAVMLVGSLGLFMC
jgi:hypothetical protein